MTVEETWEVNSKLVLTELQRNHEDHATMTTALSKLHDDIVILKLKAGFFGSVMGAIFGGLVSFICIHWQG